MYALIRPSGRWFPAARHENVSSEPHYDSIEGIHDMRRWATGMAVAFGLPVIANCSARRVEQPVSGTVVAAPAVGTAIGATARSVIQGAAATGEAGARIGRQMDQQAHELAYDLPGASVQRVGGGIVVTFPDGLLFAQETDQLSPAARNTLRRFANSLAQYPNTRVMIVGHLDASGGGRERVQELSERRARVLADFLVNVGLDRGRVTALGRGDGEPIADNESEAGRQWNRRVEVAIYADEATRFGS
jgi:outer membrane protein OmpA-like peptidoglycan-associated protein